MSDGTCQRCHGTGMLYRQDCGSHGLSLPCPDCLIDAYDDYDESVNECANCGGEGFTYGCSWDWQCDTWDGDSCLCTRRCEWCQPLTATELAERQALRDVMASALTGEHQPKEASNAE